STVEALVEAYGRFVSLPWGSSLSGAERVWMVVYPPREERRLRMRVGEFETETKRAGHTWKLVDVTDAFAEWLGKHEYRETYFEEPELVEPAMEKFAGALAERVSGKLTAVDVDDDTIVAIVGVGSLFGLTRVSYLLERIESDIRGRVVVFFPGECIGS